MLGLRVSTRVGLKFSASMLGLRVSTRVGRILIFNLVSMLQPGVEHQRRSPGSLKQCFSLDVSLKHGLSIRLGLIAEHVGL